MANLLRKKKATSSKSSKTSSKSSRSSGSSVLGRGYAGVKKAKAEADARREANKDKLFEFWVGKDEEADLRFLTEEPITFDRHQIPNKGRYESITCPGEGCPLCANGDYARFMGAYLVIDRRSYTSQKDGKKYRNQLKIAVFGTNVLAQLDRNHEKFGLSNREWTVVRTNNAYNWERGEKDTKARSILQKALQDLDIKDPYAIVEKNVLPLDLDTLNKRFGDKDLDDDDEDESENERKVSKKVKRFAKL